LVFDQEIVMTELVLGEPIASEVKIVAEREGVSAETLIQMAWQQFQWEQRLQKISEEAAWWRSLPLEIKRKYQGKFVAVHYHQVVDSDPDEQRLHERIRKKYAWESVLITSAAPRPELVFRSPRIEGRPPL
jgi:hypothetical protein